MKWGVGGRWGVVGPEMPTDTTYHRDLSCLSVPSSMHIERLLVGPSDELGLAQARTIASYSVAHEIRANGCCFEFQNVD